jgi:hypothetical protein
MMPRRTERAIFPPMTKPSWVQARRGVTQTVLLLMTAGAMPGLLLSQQIVDTRYDSAPRVHGLDIEGSSLASHGEGTEPSPRQGFLRYVEGLDASPRPMTEAEVATEIRDPFGMLLAESDAALPGDVTGVLALLGPPGMSSSTLPDQTVYIVHEAGQIPLAQAPDLVRRPRAVILRRDERAREAVFVAPSMREAGTLEVMGWDPGKGVFNFYERALGTDDAPIWIWKGDSSHAWRTQTRSHACFACHRNGEVNMKELRLPWQNWHSQSANIKPESIPEDSPLRIDPLYAIEPPSAFLRGGEELEDIVNQWIARSSASQIARFRAGKLGPEFLIEPFFRTTTLNLATSIEQSDSVATTPIPLPVSFFIDQRGLADVGTLFCPRMLTLANEVIVPRNEYRAMLQKFGFRLEEPGAYTLAPGDTHFAFAAPEVPRADFERVSQLVAGGLVSRQTATNLLLVDFPNPVYSPIREALWNAWQKQSPNVTPGASLDEALHTVLTAVSAAPDTPASVRAEAEAFLSRATLDEPNFKAHACTLIDAYLGAVAARLAAGEVEDYFRLLASRYAAVATSEHSALVESHLLFPKTDPFSGLVMRPSGTVEPSVLIPN